GGEVRVGAVGADEDSVLVVAELRRRRPERAVVFVRLDLCEGLLNVCLDLALAHPGVEMNAEALQRRLDSLEHLLERSVGIELPDVVALVAALRHGRSG